MFSVLAKLFFATSVFHETVDQKIPVLPISSLLTQYFLGERNERKFRMALSRPVLGKKKRETAITTALTTIIKNTIN